MLEKTAEGTLGSISYRKIGNGKRKVLFFHGFPGSSAQLRLFESFAEKLDLEALCFDRPGYYKTSFPADLAKCHSADELIAPTLRAAQDLIRLYNWNKYEIVTVSGGTPFGLSLALDEQLKNTNRVIQIRVICGMGYLKHPKIRPHFPLKSQFGLLLLPQLPGPMIQKFIQKAMVQKPAHQKNKRLPFMEYFFPSSEADNKCLVQTNGVAVLNQNLLEAVNQGAVGPKVDARVFLSDWGRNLKQLKTPVFFWHGDEDPLLKPEISETMATLLPQAGYRLVRNEGHLSLPILRAEEIMSFQF